MLDNNIKAQLKAYFEKINHAVVLTASLDDSPKAEEMLTLLQEVAEQSDKITVKTDGQAEHRPSFTVGTENTAPRSSFPAYLRTPDTRSPAGTGDH